jgi:CHASE3 domain sensor protein
MMLNPVQAPPMFMFFVKNITEQDRKTIQKCYKAFIELELMSLRLEIDYSDREESEAIKKIVEAWKKTKPELRAIIDIMERNWNSSLPINNNKAYFG